MVMKLSLLEVENCRIYDILEILKKKKRNTSEAGFMIELILGYLGSG